MFKFAFIINLPGESPGSFSRIYETKESLSRVLATGSDEMTRETVKKLAEEGYELVNFCGDFDDEMTKRYYEAAEGTIEMRHADYFPKEMEKLEASSSLKEYGIIIIARGTEETYKIKMKSPDCNVNVCFVKDIDSAKTAVCQLVADGIDFIELCSWFDKEKTEVVIEAIGGKVPVGSCGKIN
ncbi:MAG TPA: DUF6506 family protein [Bacillota bacterium]|nr:DUF6506 family protein [Bacillota bacterium]